MVAKKVEKKKKRDHDDTSLKFYLKGKTGNYKGRPKGVWYNDVANAIDIIDGSNLKLWQEQFNISPSEYYKFRSGVAIAMLTMTGSNLPIEAKPIKRMSALAIGRMRFELFILTTVMTYFYKELRKAERTKDTLLLNTFHEIFGDDAKYYTNYRKRGGNKIRKETIKKRYKTFLSNLDTPDPEKPKTFYNRDKPTGLFMLGREISFILPFMSHAFYREGVRERAIAKMKLLARRWNIHSDEVYPAEAAPELVMNSAENTDDVIKRYIEDLKNMDKELEDYRDI